MRTGTFLEINGNPDRRDLNEVNARRAVEAGVTLMIDSDAHGTETLRNIRYGVATARRAWIGPDDVANTRPVGGAGRDAQAACRALGAVASGSVAR